MFINCCLLSPGCRGAGVQGALAPGAGRRGNNRISSMSPWTHSRRPALASNTVNMDQQDFPPDLVRIGSGLMPLIPVSVQLSLMCLNM